MLPGPAPARTHAQLQHVARSLRASSRALLAIHTRLQSDAARCPPVTSTGEGDERGGEARCLPRPIPRAHAASQRTAKGAPDVFLVRGAAYSTTPFRAKSEEAEGGGDVGGKPEALPLEKEGGEVRIVREDEALEGREALGKGKGLPDGDALPDGGALPDAEALPDGEALAEREALAQAHTDEATKTAAGTDTGPLGMREDEGPGEGQADEMPKTAAGDDTGAVEEDMVPEWALLPPDSERVHPPRERPGERPKPVWADEIYVPAMSDELSGALENDVDAKEPEPPPPPPLSSPTPTAAAESSEQRLLEALKPKLSGPQTHQQFLWTQNLHGKLQFAVHLASVKYLRKRFSFDDLERGLREMLMQPPRAPGALNRLRSFWDVLFAAGYIREPLLGSLFAELLAAQGFYTDARTVMEEFRKAGVRLHAGMHEKIIFQIANAQDWDFVLQLIALSRAQLGGATRKMLNWRIQALTEMSRFASIHTMLDEFERDAVTPDRRTYDFLIAGCVRNHDYERAREYIRLMKQAGFEVHSGTWQAVIHRHQLPPGSAEQREALATLLSLKGSRNRYHLHNVLADCLADQDWAGASYVLKLFHPSPLPEHFDPSGSGSPPTLAVPEHTVRPDARTFAILMEHLIRTSAFDTVPKFWQHMELLGLRANDRAIVALMKAHVEVGAVSTAARMVFDMCRASMSPKLRSAFSYLCGWSGDPPSVGFRSYAPTVYMFNELLRGLLPQTGLRGAFVLIPVMYAANIRPNARTIQLLVNFGKTYLHLRPAELARLVSQLAVHTSQGAPTLEHLNQLLLAAVQHNAPAQPNVGWRAFNSRVTAREGTPDLIETGSANELTTAGLVLKKAGGGGALGPIVRSLNDRGARADSMTYYVRLMHEAVSRQDMPAAERIVMDLTRRGIRPNHMHFAALIRGHVAAGDMAEAERVFNSMRFMKLYVDVKGYTVLMHGYGAIGEPSNALRLFHDMLAHGIRPDFPAIDVLVGTFYGAQQYEDARRVLIEFWPHVGVFPPDLANASLTTLMARFRAMEQVKPPETMFSWDGGQVKEGGLKMAYGERHSHGKEMSKTLIRTWKGVFSLPGNLSLPLWGKDGIQGRSLSSTFFASKFRDKVIRRLGRRIWQARTKAIAVWEKKNGKPWSKLPATQRRKLNLQGYFRVRPSEMRILKTWTFVRDKRLQVEMERPVWDEQRKRQDEQRKGRDEQTTGRDGRRKGRRAARRVQ